MPVKRQYSDAEPSEKRTRFAPGTASPAPGGPGPSYAKKNKNQSGAEDSDDDDLLEADLPEGAQEAKRRANRQISGKQGYDSDSSNDEDGVVFSRRRDKGAAGDADEDEELDMFGDGAADEAPKKEPPKAKEYLDLGDIEGQEFGQESVNQKDGMDDDALDDDGDEESRRAADRIRKLDGDMGYEMTGFNMKAEMDEGRFTADGETYVANDKDEGEKHDVWLTDVDDETMAKARQAHLEREKREQALQQEEDQGGRAKEERLMREAVGLMERGETILEALQRLGQEVEKKRKEDSKKKSWAERQKERKAQQEGESNAFTQLTNIVSALSNLAQLDVYSLSRESIQRMLPTVEPTNGNGQSAPPRDTRSFQYRFSLAYIRSMPEGQRPLEREIFGPFPLQQLSQWRNTGFFGGPACENVELRSAGAQAGPWGSWETVVGS